MSNGPKTTTWTGSSAADGEDRGPEWLTVKEAEAFAPAFDRVAEAAHRSARRPPPAGEGEPAVTGFDAATLELARQVLRAMDSAGAQGLPLGRAIVALVRARERHGEPKRRR